MRDYDEGEMKVIERSGYMKDQDILKNQNI